MMKQKQIKHLKIVVKQGFCAFGILALTACQTGRMDKIEKDLFNTQTAVLDLRQDLLKQHTTYNDVSKRTSQQVYSASEQVTQMAEDIRMLKGEVDRVLTGFKTGQLPGASDEEPSLAKDMNAINTQLNELSTRMLALEQAQAEILKILSEKKKDVNSSQASVNLKDLAAFEKAFEQKKYTQIATNGKASIDKVKGSDKNKMRFIFAESLFKTGKLTDAALSYDELLKAENMKDKRSLLQLRMGDCFRQLGDTKTALIYYNELLVHFPKSPEAALASSYVKKLEKK